MMLPTSRFKLTSSEKGIIVVWIALMVSSSGLKIGVLVNIPLEERTPDILRRALSSDCLIQVTNGSVQTDIELMWHFTNQTNGMLLSQEVCRMMSEGIHGLITVLDCRSQLFVTSRLSRLPHILVSKDHCSCAVNNQYSRQISPNYTTKSSLLKDLISYARWHRFAFIFDETIGTQERRDAIFALSSIQVESTIVVMNSSIRQSEAIRKLSHLKKYGYEHIVVWAQKSTCQIIFAAAAALKIDTVEYYWVVFQPDVSPPETRSIFMTNTPSNALVVSRVSPHLSDQACWRKIPSSQDLKMGLISNIFEAIVLISLSHRPDSTRNPNNSIWISEQSSPPVPQKIMTSSLNESDNNGEILFRGFPNDVHPRLDQYDLHSVTSHPPVQLLPVGRWDSDTGMSVHSQVGLFVNRFRDFRQQIINVTAKQELPFVIRSFNGTHAVYSGLAFDILNELAERLNFRYVVVEPEDRRYGAPNEDGSWNGMVGMVKRQEVVVAVGPFSITALRDTVIDYTKPYMDDSIGILTRKPQKVSNLFQMMRPFSRDVWVCILVLVILFGVLLTVINRLTPYSSRHIDDGSFVWDEHSLSQNLWIIYMSVMEQGAAYIPAANSSRCILGFWWIFTILIISTYTANLAAFLTVADPPPAINTLTELLRQQDLGVLVQDGSNLWSMFKDSKNPVYQEMWKRLEDSPVVDGLDAALPYVRTGKYAYVGDKSTLEYVAAQDCHTFVVADESFNAGTYGLIMPENSPFKEAMDYYIMKMLEAGLLTNWRQKWWAKADNCTSRFQTGSASGLSLDTLGGVFIVYLACVMCAVILLLISFVTNSKCRAVNKQDTNDNEPKSPDIENGVKEVQSVKQ